MRDCRRVLEKHKNTACAKHHAAATAGGGGGGGAPVRIGCRAPSVLNAAFYSLLCLSLLLEARNRDHTLEGRESEPSERASEQKRLPDRAQLARRAQSFGVTRAFMVDIHRDRYKSLNAPTTDAGRQDGQVRDRPATVGT